MDTGRLTFATGLPRLMYRRSAFPWRNVDDFSMSPVELRQPFHANLAPSAPRVDPVDPDTPLMEAGVTSQLAVRLAAQLQKLTGTALSATLVFEHPTPRAIAAHLSMASEVDGQALSEVDIAALVSELRSAGPTASASRPQAKADTTFGIAGDAALPASDFQQHFLLLHLLQPHVASYSLPVTIEWPSRCPQPLVRVALHLLVRRHAVLRTFYQMSQTGVQQIILPADGFVVPLDMCSEADWHAQSAQTLSQPFALTKAPPIRALLMYSDVRQRTRLLVVVDHVAADYASTLIIQRELHLACGALHRGVSPVLPHLQLQYADFALWREQHRVSGDAAALEWWRHKLDGAPQLLEIPLDRPRPPKGGAVGGSVNACLDSTLGTALSKLCTQERVSTLCCLLAAWAVLMMQLSGQDAVVLGQPYSVQLEYTELRNVVGCFATPGDQAQTSLTSPFFSPTHLCFFRYYHRSPNSHRPGQSRSELPSAASRRVYRAFAGY